MAIKAEASFSLKDELFNDKTVARLAKHLRAADPKFNQRGFKKRALSRFPELELKERIAWLVAVLEAYLPERFEAAVAVLDAALPPPLDPSKTDDDFGEFIWIVPGEYVARHGCSEAHLGLSLDFLREATKRFSSENAIRPFLASYPEQTMAFVRDCAVHPNYHVRRLASEGIRPFLPWAPRVEIPAKEIVGVLDVLHADPTRYVTRSVANTLNDLSKLDPELVLRTLKRWRRQKRQAQPELDFVTRHSLRTLTKKDHVGALALLGYPANARVRVTNVEASDRVELGGRYEFRATLTSGERQKLLVALRLYYLKANGEHAPKVFAVKDVEVSKGERVEILKRQPFKAITTRTLYPGVHKAELVVNGRVVASHEFNFSA